MIVKNITVVGAGAMGAGIAQVCAQAGYQVHLYDIEPSMLDSAREDIARFVRRGAEKKQYTLEVAEAAVARISTTIDLADAVRDADLVIEAVFENMEVKKKLHWELNGVAPDRTIFASNTSSLSVCEMAAASHRPQKFVGMHFFNPAPLMRLVEVVQGAETSVDTVETAVSLARSFDKTPVVVQDAPNFIVNRVSRPWYYEASFLLMEGAPAQDVDAANRLGAGMRMGPLELMDLTGLAVHLASSDTAQREWGDPKWRPAPLVRRLVRSGHTGRRAGKGLYTYADGVQTPRHSAALPAAEPYQVDTILVVGRGEGAYRLAAILTESEFSTIRCDDSAAAASSLEGADMVVESLGGVESEPVVDLFKMAARACAPSTVFVTTSPCLSPGELGSGCGRPEQVVGMHEPFPFMIRKFIEIARGLDSGDRAIATAVEVSNKMGYSWVVMDETPCYYVYRNIVPMMNEAAFALFEGLASAEDIDTAMKLGMNHPLGPLEWADRLGLDVVLNIMETLMRDFGDPRYRPCVRIRQLVRAGHLGVKTGRGFYQY
ncbi:MAG: 3-hydroxyacyl-CoA dehydrogenase NAD-binding domain-containing protein [Chloroflexi bacterium]|nr:3-hydroxyacyl-CoA dehydrogenase NAD-binding domain-containing protein [Chloroflexota bacterium]